MTTEGAGLSQDGPLPMHQRGRIGIITGSGRLPELLAQRLANQGQNPFIANLIQANQTWIEAYDHANINLGKPSTLLRTLEDAKVSTLIMAGGVSIRPPLFKVLTDWRMYGEFLRILKARFSGDDGLLRIAINFFERNGFAVIGTQEVLPELLTPKTILTTHKPGAQNQMDIEVAIQAAIQHGRKDLGQAAVACAGQVIALEGKSGTAAMLAALRREVAVNGVLVKWSKPGQELRVDLPTIGPDTILQVKSAGLAGIVVEAGRSIILDQQDVIRLANQHGVFVMGAGRE